MILALGEKLYPRQVTTRWRSFHSLASSPILLAIDKYCPITTADKYCNLNIRESFTTSVTIINVQECQFSNIKITFAIS